MEVIMKEESYAERRQLFKNIWETAMQIDEKDGDIMTKPKVIKTLRLDEVDRCVIGKKKKERIKNLRTVCNKILDFCDRQDADDLFYEQLTEGKVPHQLKLDFKPKKERKTHRGRKKITRTKSLYVSANKQPGGDHAEATTSEKKEDYPIHLEKTSRRTSPARLKRQTVVRRTLVRHRHTAKYRSGPDNADANYEPGKVSSTRRKVVRKRRSKRKKTSESNVSSPRPQGTSNNDRRSNVSTAFAGRAIVRRIKQILTDHEIVVK